MRFATLLAVAMVVCVGACAIRQDVVPVGPFTFKDRTICIVEHPATRAQFLAEYQRQLQNRGYEVRVIAPNSSTRSCPHTTTYVARWSWDFTIYMSYVDIRVFDDGREIGHASYDARQGGGRLDKWVDAEAKIAELVAQLLPGAAQ